MRSRSLRHAHASDENYQFKRVYAKAEPDIQALIAERVEAGEIFTAKVR
jgi:hypothetical protein